MEADDKTEGPATEGLATEGRVSGQAQRRARPRHSVDEDILLLLVNHGLPVAGRVIDLSMEGCRIRTRERFSAGAGFRVEVTFRINGIDFRFSGLTQWTDGRNLVGIRFVDLTSRRKEELAEVLCEVEADRAAKAEKEIAECLAAQEQAQEQAQQKQARKPAERPPSQRAGIHVVAVQTLPTPQPAELQQATPSPSKRDRRVQSRLTVDTSAVIYLVKTGSKLSGRILDLSLSGCRIRTDERFPVGIYTRVEAEFRLEGLPFRLAGVTQAIHDRQNVGIRFIDLSVRKREQVEQLIGEIEGMQGRGKLPEPGESGG